MEHSTNSALASSVNGMMARTAKELTAASSHGETFPYAIPQVLPIWMKWTIVVSVILIALAYYRTRYATSGLQKIMYYPSLQP